MQEHYYSSNDEFEECPTCGERTRWDGWVGRYICPNSNGAEFEAACEDGYNNRGWDEYPDHLGYDHPNLCGFAEGGNPDFEGFDLCNLKYGCPYCRTKRHYLCPVCQKETGYVNDAGGMTFTCGHR